MLDANNPLNAELKGFPSAFSVKYIGLNVNEPPLDDSKVRQALNLAIDRKELATIVLGGQVVPAKGILPLGFPVYAPDLEGYGFDPERARQLLAESKYGGDLENIPPITLNVSRAVGSAVSLDMAVVKRMWEKNLGLSVEIAGGSRCSIAAGLLIIRTQKTFWASNFKAKAAAPIPTMILPGLTLYCGKPVSRPMRPSVMDFSTGPNG